MRRILITLFLLFIGWTIHAQVMMQSSGSFLPDVHLIHSDIETSTIQYTFPGFVLDEVTENGQQYHRVLLEETVSMLEAGSPDVPVSAFSVIIPDNGRMMIEVLSSSFQEFNNIRLIPSKGNLTRDIDPKDIPLQEGIIYTQDRFYPGELASLRDPYILRDYRGQTIVIKPFQYNPVTRVLRVYYDITVKVVKAESGGINLLERPAVHQPLVEEFYHIYNRHFLNFGSLGIMYVPVGEVGNMLVISHGTFIPEMEEFVMWKNQKGIPCEMVDVSTIGTTAAAIKTYVTNYYNTNGLTYLLLVGDAAQIPTNSLSSGHSDNAYAYILGNDHYPEFFVGRFSAENLTHVQIQALRTLSYEIHPDTSGAWLKKSIGIASDQGPGDDNEMDYQHVRNMQSDLLNFTQTTNLEFFDGSQGGNDAPGDPNSTMVQNAIDAGAGVILYTGHGSSSSWGTSGFGVSHVATLNNYNWWPFIWAVACVNGNFVSNTCLAEAFLRALKSDQPTGSIAFLGSTINQSWDPPMEGQDEMVDILVESYPNNIKRTFGGLSMNGCMKMNDTYSSAGNEMTDTWTLFGDPSLHVYTSTPLPITATHQPVAFLGAVQFPVFCPVNGAKATLSLDGEILGTGIVSGSTVIINYTSPLAPDTLLLVITGFNRIPYIAEIPLIVSNAPYVTYHSHIVNDQGTNNNQRADFGETVSLDMTLENIGVLTANGVNAILKSLDPYVTVMDSTATFGNITDGTTHQTTNAFTVALSDSVPDGHLAAMRLIITDNASNQWISSFHLLCNAPHLVFDTVFFNDVIAGNGNGKLEPGEVVIIHAIVRNIGGAEAQKHTCTIYSSSPFAPVFGNDSVSFTQVPLLTPVTVQFYARLDTGLVMGSAFQFDLLFSTGAYHAQAVIGDMVMSGDEDWETGNFTKFNWQSAGNNPWTITNLSPYEGTYCARSGAIGNNAYSSLSIDWYAAFPDTISFWLKVSCENGSASGQKWDFLEFYIDGVAQAWWDGNKPWMKVSYPVAMGQHTFTWRYEKDMYATGGSDAAWIDLITFPAAGGEVELMPFVLIDLVDFTDPNGNNNGMIEPGELIDIAYTATNIGFADAANVNGLLATTEPMISLVDSNGIFGNMPAGSQVLTGNTMQVRVSQSAISGQVFFLDLTLTDDSTNTWNYPFTMMVEPTIGTPELPNGTEWNIYPNPFTDQFHVVIPETDHPGAVRITLWSLDGRLMLDRIVEPAPGERTMTLDTGGIPTETMVIRAIFSDRVLTRKIIKR